MSFKFEKIIVWQRAMEYGEMLFTLSKKFPESEKFNLISQMNRAGDSVALDIAEGSILQSKPEFQRFLGYSIRSLAEVVTCLYKAKNRKYIIQDEFDLHYKFAFDLMNSIISLRKNLK